MIRFDLVRKKWTSFSLALLMAAGLMVSVPQASHASDWVDLLKPLVKDVIVPGASMGMKKFIARQQKLHPELANFNNSSDSSSSTTSSAIDDFFNNTGSSGSSTTSSSVSEFSSPEEPISTSNAGSAFWETSTSASATDPAPPPPPPVATP
jgi:hypothetical protein